MKSLSPELQAHLDEGTTTLSSCWRLSRGVGASFGFTDHDRPRSCERPDFAPGGGRPASEGRPGADLSVDAQDA